SWRGPPGLPQKLFVADRSPSSGVPTNMLMLRGSVVSLLLLLLLLLLLYSTLLYSTQRRGRRKEKEGMVE
ncbi:MAG: hypothetical protein J4G04_07635, partial [Nitrosopumilaceae archaeon]|nr:hypothetical protein [Nitrosopumilaceae archaeon]